MRRTLSESLRSHGWTSVDMATTRVDRDGNVLFRDHYAPADDRRPDLTVGLDEILPVGATIRNEAMGLEATIEAGRGASERVLRLSDGSTQRIGQSEINELVVQMGESFSVETA